MSTKLQAYKAARQAGQSQSDAYKTASSGYAQYKKLRDAGYAASDIKLGRDYTDYFNRLFNQQEQKSDPYEQYKRNLAAATQKREQAQQQYNPSPLEHSYETAWMDMPSFGELWKQRQEYRDARVEERKAEKDLSDQVKTGEAMKFLQKNGGDLDKAIEAATAGLNATSGKTGLFTDKQTRTQARSDRDRYQSYLDVYRSVQDQQVADAWIKGNAGDKGIKEKAQAEYDTANRRVQELTTALQMAEQGEADFLGRLGLSWSEANTELNSAVRSRNQASIMLRYAQDETDNEVTRDADFASKAAEGQRKFEEYKAGRYVSPEAEAEHERIVGRHTPTGDDPTASQETAQAAEFEFMEREANASRYDPKYHREYMEPDERWTDEERQKFYAMYYDDEERAADYAARINRRYNSEDAAERDLYTEEFATRNALTGALATAASIPGHLGAGNIDYAKMALEYAYRGDLYETQYEGWSRDSDVARSAIAQKLNEVGPTIDESVPVLGGKGLGDLYQIGVSMAESAVAVSMGGKAANAMFFGSAASSTTRDALNRGLSAGQALGLGAASGAAEVGGETLSVEHLLNQGDLSKVLTKGILASALAQGGIEASEEFLTTLANTFADNLISGDKSEYKQNLYTNLANGMSYDEAQRAAFQEWAYGIAMDTLGGFISGAGMSGMRSGGMALGGMQRQYTGDVQQLIENAQLTDEGSKARQLAEKYSTKENLNQYQASKLQAATNAELSGKDRASLIEAATKRLQELGVENPERMAKTIVNQVMDTSRSDVQKFLDSQYMKQHPTARFVANDIVDALNGKAVEWAKGIQTKNTGRISEVYQRMSDRTRNVTIDGQTHKIERLSMNDGKLNVTYTANGVEHTISADDAKLSPDVQSALKTVKEILGDDAEYALQKMERFQNPYDYAVSYATIRDTFGKEGAKESAALASPLRGGLSDTQVIHAMARGYVAHRVTGRTKRGAGVVTTNGGMLNGRELQGVSEDILKNDQDAANYVEAWKGLAQAMGINVRFFQGKTDSQGRVVYGSEGDPNGAYYNGELWLDINAGMKNLKQTAERSVFRTAAHELTHFIEHNSNKYEELKEFVTGYLKEAMGEDFNALVKSKIAREPGLSYEGAIHEVVADACETMLKDSKYINKMMDENPGLFETIRGWLRDFFNKILAVDTGAKYLQPVIDQVQKLWDDALQDAVESRLSDETMADPITFEEAATVEPEIAQEIVQREEPEEEKPAKKTAKKPAKQKAERNEPWLNKSLSKSERERLRRRFNAAKKDMIASYLAEGVELTDEEAKKILLDYYAITGYYSLSDEDRQTSNSRKRQNWSSQRAARYGEDVTEVDDPSDTVADVTNADGKTVAVVDNSTGNAQFSIKTYNDGGRRTLRDYLNSRVQSKDLTKAEADQIFNQMEQLYRICKDYDNSGKYVPFSAWSHASVVTYDGKPVFSVVKANGEYKLNLDFSLVCKKRRTLDAVFNRMISMGIMDDFNMFQESIAKINDIIRDNGFETACGLCFVDAKRYRQAIIADAFKSMYNYQVLSLVKKDAGQHVDFFNYGGDKTINNTGEGIDTLDDSDLNWSTIDEILRTAKKTTVKWKIADYLKNNPSARKLVLRGDFMSTAGFDALKANNPELLSLYNSKKGAGGPKAAQSDVQYLNEIINSGSFNVKAAYEVGGVRIQSFSDYVGRLVFDYVQMVGDLAAKKLPAHSYTKEFMFALQFGLTGIKINMSLVPEVVEGGVAAGLDANGNYTWKDGQSFGSTVYDTKGKRMTAAEGFELAKRIQNADGYSKNCGTIAVGVSDKHIQKMLDDPEIRMIIPYHKSSLNHIVASMMNIDKYTDYTLQQNTRRKVNGKLSKIPAGSEFNFNEALQRLGDAKAAANEYLDWCKENGYTPKFDKFSDHENYYKLLEDFSCYDKDGVTNAPMGAVQAIFPTENDAFGSMKDLIAQGLEEDALLQAKQDAAVPKIISDIQAILPGFEGDVKERSKKGKKGKKAEDRAQLSTKEQETSVKAQREVAQGVKPRLNTYAVEEVGIETATPEVASDLQAAPYVQYSVKTDELSDRDMLLNANSTTDAELAALQDYQAKAQNYTAREKKVSDALREMDRMVRTGASKDAINKQRAKISNLEAGMAKALRELTQAEQGTTIQEILQRERDIQRRRTRQQVNETLSKRELRRRIDALHKSLVSRIKNPTEKKNIPPAVMQQAIDVLEAINMDTTIPGSKRGESVRSKLVELKQRYEELKNDKDFRAAAVYDSQVAEFLENMIKEVGDTPINRMSASQLESVYNVLAALDRTARKALKIRIGNQERDAYEISKAMTRETRSSKKQHTSLLDSYLNAQLSPERFFARMGNHHKNSTWSQIYRMLNDGQLKQTQITMEASMIFGDLLTDKRYDKLIDPKQTVDLGLKDENGKMILITHGMMVALYMHLQNEQNVRHVAYGGLTIPSLKDYYNGKKVKGSENASRVGGVLQEVADLKDQLYETMDAQTAADLQARIDEAGLRAMDYIDQLRAAIDKNLTDYDRQWIAASKELFDGYSKSRLNETTMDVYGIKRANVDNYFPIWVDGDFLNTPFETVAKDMSLENAGFMKERIDSSKPIRLADISDVASSQIRKVSQYCGLMPVIRNFNKIWGKTQTGYRDSVQNAVHQVYGNSGIKYIENLMADLNGARNGGESSLVDMLNAVRGHMAQASLTLNPRVAFGQTASFPSAAAVVGWDALRKAFFKGGKNGQMISRADQDLIRKWSPLLWYRLQGYSTTELGDIAGMNSKVDRIWKKARWLTGWIQAMDGATVGRLWYAAEYYVQDNTKLEKGSDAYYEKVAEIFNDIVERTQPNYTVMQRPDILRNPQALVKQLTMFLTQRLQNFNILYDSLATYSQAKQDLKDHAFDTTAEDVRQAGIGARRAVISQVAAAATITAFKFLADALLHSMSAYRDDDKELTKESISLQLLNMFMDSLTGNLLGGSEIYDVIESKVFNKTYYGIELSGISTVMDVVNSTTGFVETAFNNEADSKAKLKAADKLAKNLGSLVGLPFANAEKIVKGFLYTAQDIANGDPWQTAGVDRTTSQQANRLYKAYEDMQYGKVQKIREEVGDDEKLDTQIKSMIKERFVGSELSGTDAVHHLTTWLGVRDKDAEKIVREWQCERDTGIKYDDMREAFLAGQISAKSAANMRIKYGGMEPADAEKTVSKWQCEIDTGIPYEELRTEFIDGNISYNQIVSYMVKYGGRDQEDAEKSAYQYQFIGENDQYSDVSVTAATKYYAGGFEAAGIPKDYYLEIYTMADTGFKADYKANGQPISNSKKIKVMAYIDSLPISDALKDQLYLIDYKESTLAKTPWNKRR